MTDEDTLATINEKLGDLLALYKLVHLDQIIEAKTAVLGEGTRKKVYDLCDGATPVTEIAQKLKVTPPAVSQHLAALMDSGLVAVDSSTGKRLYVKRLER